MTHNFSIKKNVRCYLQGRCNLKRKCVRALLTLVTDAVDNLRMRVVTVSSLNYILKNAQSRRLCCPISRFTQ